VPTHQYFSDSSIYDSYELIKGPAQALYLGAGIGGVVLATTKKPLRLSRISSPPASTNLDLSAKRSIPPGR